MDGNHLWAFPCPRVRTQGSMGSECSSEPSGGSNVGQDIRLSRQQGLKRSSQHTQRVPSVVGQSGSAPPTTRGGAHRLTHEDSHEHQHQLPRSHHVPHLHAMHQVRQQQVCDGMSDLQSQSKTGSVYLDTDTGVAAGPFTMPYAAMAMRMGGGGGVGGGGSMGGGGGVGVGMGGQSLLGGYSSNFVDTGGEQVRMMSTEGL